MISGYTLAAMGLIAFCYLGTLYTLLDARTNLRSSDERGQK